MFRDDSCFNKSIQFIPISSLQPSSSPSPPALCFFLWSFNFLLFLCDSSHLPFPIYLFSLEQSLISCYLHINLQFLECKLHEINTTYSFDLGFSLSMIILEYIHVFSWIVAHLFWLIIFQCVDVPQFIYPFWVVSSFGWL